MAVVTTRATVLSNMDLVPAVLAGPFQWRSPINRMWARSAKAAGDSNNSLYPILRVHSAMLIDSLAFLTDAWGSGGLVDIGLYDTPANGGAIIGTGQEFGASVDVSAAITAKKALENIAGQVAMTQRVWERLGLSSDPNKDYEIVLKAVAIGASQAANFFMSCAYQR